MWAQLAVDRRFVVIAFLGTLGGALALAIPTGIIPNSLFSRMTPVEPFNYPVLLASAPLIGLLLATQLAPPMRRLPDPHARSTMAPTSLGGLAAFLAIGCPICNKLVVAALGVSGALNVFAPIQPILGAGSVLLLASTLGWRLRDRWRGCTRCAVAPAA